MAKVVGPLHSSEARGRMGGLVYNTHRGVSVVKAKHAPCQPRTALQLQVRALATQFVRGWALVANKAAWNDYAALHPTVDGMGNSIRATGANWYVALNTRLARLMSDLLTLPPTTAPPDPVTLFTATGSAGTLTFTWGAPIGAGTRIEIWLDGAHSAGRIGSLARANWAHTFAGDATPKTIMGLAPGVYSVYARQVGLVTGLVSTYVLATATVT